MKVFYEKPLITDIQIYGVTYECDHPVYNRCTLFLLEKDTGIAVIQQRFDPKTKHTWWGEIDPYLANDIYLSKNFMPFLSENAAQVNDIGLYPTFPVRQLMWSLRLPPVKKEVWETRFN